MYVLVRGSINILRAQIRLVRQLKLFLLYKIMDDYISIEEWGPNRVITCRVIIGKMLIKVNLNENH